MVKLEREPHHLRGARFFRYDGKDMFEHRIDASSIIGPRVASKIDKENHPEKWAEYQAAFTDDLNTEVKKKGK